jgi:RHS repeat-associated protein
MIRDTDTPAGARQKLVFEYDHQGRRIRKQFFTYNGGWQEPTDTLFLYDGWNLVTELNANSNNAKVRSYVWGTDLSGSMRGAGGVGGLLKVTYVGASTTNAFVAYDGNGNAAVLLDAANGSAGARYEYGPFAELIRVTGPLGKLSPIRFSMKYVDDESGLSYYGYRYLAPSMGRWISPDPLQDHAFPKPYGNGNPHRRELPFSASDGLTLYVFAHNEAIAAFDLLGLSVACHLCSTDKAQELAAVLSQRFLPATQGEGGKEALGKICCNQCSGRVYNGTVVYAPDADPFKPRPGDSKCDKGDLVIAVWHTHPEHENAQNPGGGIYSPDHRWLDAFAQSDAACAGIVSYMRYSATGFTSLDPHGIEKSLEP